MNEFRTRVEKAIGDAVGEQGPVGKLVSEGDMEMVRKGDMKMVHNGDMEMVSKDNMELVCKGLSEIRKCLKVFKVRWWVWIVTGERNN